MDKKTDTDTKKSSAPPAPEVLKAQADEETTSPDSSSQSTSTKSALHPRHVTYRPSHKATFIGLGVVARHDGRHAHGHEREARNV